MTSALLALVAGIPVDEVVTWAELIARSSQHTARTAVSQGLLVRVARGRYRRATPARLRTERADWDAPEADIHAVAADLATARAYRGALCLESAARAHGWPTLLPPPVTTIVVPRTTHCVPRPGLRFLRRDLPSRYLEDARTTPVVTALQCAATLPFHEALAVADSALRTGQVGRLELIAAAETFRGRGALQARRVAHLADGGAANPFESALRAVAADVPGLHLEPQVEIRALGRTMRVDLADVAQSLVLEADSYRFHGGSAEFAADVDRYDRLTAAGWVVLRATWEQVRQRPEELRRMIDETLSTHRRRPV